MLLVSLWQHLQRVATPAACCTYAMATPIARCFYSIVYRNTCAPRQPGATRPRSRPTLSQTPCADAGSAYAQANAQATAGTAWPGTQLLRCQYLYVCTSKTSTLCTSLVKQVYRRKLFQPILRLELACGAVHDALKHRRRAKRNHLLQKGERTLPDTRAHSACQAR